MAAGEKVEITAGEADEAQDGIVLALGTAMRDLDEIKERIAGLVTALAAKREVVLLLE